MPDLGEKMKKRIPQLTAMIERREEGCQQRNALSLFLCLSLPTRDQLTLEKVATRSAPPSTKDDDDLEVAFPSLQRALVRGMRRRVKPRPNRRPWQA